MSSSFDCKSFFVFLFPTFKRNSFVLLVNFMWFNSKSFRYLISDTVYINTALSCSFETLSSNRYNLKFTAKLAFDIKLFNVCYANFYRIIYKRLKKCWKFKVGNYNFKNGNSKLTLKIPTFTFEVLKLKFKTTIKVENFNFKVVSFT